MTPVQIAVIVADELRGTCNSLLQVLEQHDAEEMELNSEFCDALDSHVFECQRCNWWFEQSEMADRKDGEWICEDCTDDEERL